MIMENFMFDNFVVAASGPTVVAPIISFNWTLLMLMITVLVLFIILKKAFFDKVKNFMDERTAGLQGAFDSADLANKAAEAKLEEYEKKIAFAEQEGRDIVKAAKTKADARAKEILDDANEKANSLVLKAEEEIVRQRQKAVDEIKNEISMLAILVAERILNQELKDVPNQEKIVNQVIEEVGSAKWKN